MLLRYGLQSIYEAWMILSKVIGSAEDCRKPGVLLRHCHACFSCSHPSRIPLLNPSLHTRGCPSALPIVNQPRPVWQQVQGTVAETVPRFCADRGSAMGMYSGYPPRHQALILVLAGASPWQSTRASAPSSALWKTLPGYHPAPAAQKRDECMGTCLYPCCTLHIGRSKKYVSFVPLESAPATCLVKKESKMVSFPARCKLFPNNTATYALITLRCVWVFLMLAVVFAVGDFVGRAFAGHGPWAHGLPKPLSVLAYAIGRYGMWLWKGLHSCTCLLNKGSLADVVTEHQSCTCDIDFKGIAHIATGATAPL
eukprot:607931-Pelagomonas_calceolata.AAC.1